MPQSLYVVFTVCVIIFYKFWVAYVGCETNHKDAVERTLEQIDVIKRLVAKYNDSMQLVTEADGIMQAFNESRIASLICKF